MVKAVNITPTWAGIMPGLLAVIETARSTEARNSAKAELLRLAKIADAAGDLVAYVQQFGDDPKGHEYGLTAKELRELVMVFFDESKPNPVAPPTLRHVAPPSVDPWAGSKEKVWYPNHEVIDTSKMPLTHEQKKEQWLASGQAQYVRTVLAYILSLSGVYDGKTFDRIEVWGGDTVPDDTIDITQPEFTELSDEQMRALVGWLYEIDGPVKYLFATSNGSYPWVQFVLDGIESNPAEMLQDHSTGNWPGDMDEKFTDLAEPFEKVWLARRG